ncbi:MAG: glycosyltransferase [Balneolaceae bacterium]
MGFSIEGNSGKSKATVEKAKELKRQTDKFSFYSLNKSTGSTYLNYMMQVIFEVKYCIKYLLKEKPDVLFARSNFGILLVILTRFFNTYLIFEVHSDFKDESKILYRNNYILKKISLIVNYISIISYKNSDGIIFNNPDLENYFISEYSLQEISTISIYNGSNIEEFYPENRFKVRKKLCHEIKENDLLFVFTGSVSQWHGVEYLINTFIELKEIFNERNLLLYIVGGGSNQYRLSLKNQYSSEAGITFIDEVSTNIARDYINASDVCMLPVAKIRVSQGSPLKLYDYIACGRPVITQSNINGYSDVINKYELGIDVDFYTPDKAASLIVKFLKKTDLNNLGNKNREKAINNLSWEKVIHKWIQFAIKNDS